MPSASQCVRLMVDHGYLAGVPHPSNPQDLLVAVTESRTSAEIEGLVNAFVSLKGFGKGRG